MQKIVICETTGYGRKGRGKTYVGEVCEVLKMVWREAGCPCLPYFKAEIGRWADEYSSEVAQIRPETKALLLEMSDRTMSGILSGEPCVKPGWSRANKRSGRGARNEVKAHTPCASGESYRASFLFENLDFSMTNFKIQFHIFQTTLLV